MDLTRITLNDPDASYSDLVAWAKKYCSSYHRCDVTDVSDVSTSVDLIYEFWFQNPKEATIFLLKWS